jgi:hypothetical protein
MSDGKSLKFLGDQRFGRRVKGASCSVMIKHKLVNLPSTLLGERLQVSQTSRDNNDVLAVWDRERVFIESQPPRRDRFTKLSSGAEQS